LGTKTPRIIKIEVIRKWLEGKSRDQIAKELQVATGTISGIIKECRLNDSEFDLLRAVAVKLRNQGTEIESFAPLVRLREIVKEAGGLDIISEGHEQGTEEKFESLLVNLEVFCFKQNRSVNEFVNLVHNISRVAEILAVPLDKFPSYIKKLESDLHRLTKEIEQKKLEKQDAFQDYGVTLNSLEQFNRNRPSYEEYREQKLELEKVKREGHSYKQDLENERFWRAKEEKQMWAIAEPELDKANRELGLKAGSYVVGRLNPRNLNNMVTDLYYHPSKYVEVIRRLMDIYDLEHRGGSERGSKLNR
jgi:CENP-B N-terminal DNA-binding domain